MTESPTYPVRVDGSVDPSASRGLWLVKWLLLIPHCFVLAFLWLAFCVLSVIAFFAILFTGRYPRALFEFNVGVLRWSWRVSYYGYSALGTDRYPPFTLADVPDYPAHLDVAYPERLSRGLVLVKWWLLAIPHYIVLAVFVGGGAWLSTRYGDHSWQWGAGGLVGLLVLISAVVLLFTGRYPRPLYDFVMGMNRWALRVAAYAGLMTDRYPPFRLDMGGTDPGSVPAVPPPPSPLSGQQAATAVAAPASAPSTRPAGTQGGWSTGRIISVVVGAVLLFVATAALFGGGGLLWADRTQREGDYVMSPTTTVSTGSYAVTSDHFRLEGAGLDWAVDNVLGTARLEATPTSSETDLFVGIGRTTDVARYLSAVGYRQLGDLGPRWDGGQMTWSTTQHAGGAPAVPPEQAGVWTASSSGPGTRVLTWRPSAGDWTVVVMRTDGTAGVAADLRAGATLPGLPWIAASVLGVGVVLLAVGALLVALGVHRTRQAPPPSAPPAGTPPQPELVGSGR